MARNTGETREPRHAPLLSPRMLLILACTWLSLPMSNAHSFGLHKLEGEPEITPLFSDFGGGYDISFKARFDSEHHGFQTLFEFHDGTGGYRFTLFQVGTLRAFNLQMDDGDSIHTVNWVNSNAFEIGVLHEYRVGANATNSWIYRDGSLLHGRSSSTLPPVVARTSQLLGDSNLPGSNRLEGAIMGFTMKSDNNPRIIDSMRFGNYPGQLFVLPFTLSFHAVFRNLTASPSQTVIQMYNNGAGGSPEQALYIGIFDGTKLTFSISQFGSTWTLNASNIILEDEWALFHCNVDAAGDMMIRKKGVIDGTTTVFNNFGVTLERSIQRNILIGDSTDNNKLVGAVVGLRLDPHDAS